MNRFIYGLIALCFIVFTGCDDNFLATDITPIPENVVPTTTFKIRMQDAPIAYEEVNIDLQGVIVYGRSKKEVDSIELGVNVGIYNLLDFQDGLDTLIASADISVDTIKEVRLILGENNTVKLDGEIHELTIPGNAKNGLRIKVCIPLANFEEFVLNIDFDAEKSVKKTGIGFKMKPVIKVLNPGIGQEENADYELEEEEDDDDENPQNMGEELPDNIQMFIEANYPEYAIKNVDSLTLCDGTETIAIKIQEKSDKVYLYFDELENYLQKGTTIKKQDIPAAILTALDEDYKGFKPTNPLAKIILADEHIQYELTIRKGNDEKQILVGEDGTIICEF